MASYNTPYDYYSYSQPRAHGSAMSVHLFLFLATLFLLAFTSLYSRYESAMESLLEQLRFLVILSPLLLLLVVQYYWVATGGAGEGRRGGLGLLLAPLVAEQRDSSERGSGASSPWGVALALALVLLLISYQSSFQGWWFPLLSR